MAKTNSPPMVERETFGVLVRYADKQTTVTHNDFGKPGCRLATQAGKLHALTYMINGEGFDVFDGAAESIKRNLVWLIDDLAHEVLALASAAEMIDLPTEVNHG